MSQTEPVITMVQGETMRFRVRVRSKSTGAPIDLTDTVITSQVKRSYSSPDVEAEITIERDPVEKSVFYWIIEDEKSALVPEGRHVFNVRIEFADGTVKKRPRGQLLVLPG